MRRDRTVLELAGGIALGTQVGQLLELQRPFEGDRVAHVTPEVEEVPDVDQLRCHVVHVVRPPEGVAHQPRQRLHGVEHLVGGRRRQRAGDLGQVEAEHLERHDLGQMALRRGDADLRPGPGVEHAVSRARHGRIDHVGDHQDLGAEARRFPQGLGRVERLSGLRHAHAERALVEHRVAVAELARDVDLGRELHPVLNGVLGHQRGVVARAAGHDEHLVDVAEVRRAQTHLVQDQLATGTAPVEQRVRHGLGLLVHLLRHEVLGSRPSPRPRGTR